MGKIYVIGLGPGDEKMMTAQAADALLACDVVVGYKVYIDLIRDMCAGRELIESNMRQEQKRCETCVELAVSGKNVALVCSGDAGVYGMASPLLEIAAKAGFDDIAIIPGVTAALSGAALLGAPIGHDFCVISLSDLRTPWEIIEKRLRLAAEADLCIVLYNPASHKRADYLERACRILMERIDGNRSCGYVKNAGRDGTISKVCTLGELAGEEADMFTTVFIGNSQTYITNGRLITPRGYDIQ